MRNLSTQLFLFIAILLCPAAVMGQGAKKHRFVVPVAGSVRGVGDVVWQTDVMLRNRAAVDIEIMVAPLASPDQLMLTTLPAGEELLLSDVGATFALNRLSAIVVESTGDTPVEVQVQVYGIHPERITPTLGIPIINLDQRARSLRLDSLALSKTQRTNIGLLNLGDSPVLVTLALQRAGGRNLAVHSVTLAPNALLHAPLQTWFPLVQEGTGLSLLIDTGQQNVYGYACVVQNANDSATFVAPVKR